MPLQARRGGSQGAARGAGGDEPSVPHQFLMKTLAKQGGYDSDYNGRTLIRKAQNELGADVRLPIRGDGTPFVPVAYEGETYPQLVDKVTTSRNGKQPAFGPKAEFESALAKAHGADAITDEIRDEALSDAQAHQAFMSSAYLGNAKAVAAAMSTAGPMLAGKNTPPQLFDVLGIQEQQLRAKYGNDVADGFLQQAQEKLAEGKVQEVVDMVGFTQDQLRKVVPPEVNTVEGFNAPLLKDMPAWGQALAIGGVGGASTALAMHLMAQGQQQQSSMEYAAAMQALNAY